MKLLYTLSMLFMVLSALGQRPVPSAKDVMPDPQRGLGQQARQEGLDTLSPGNELNATNYIRFWYGEEEGFVFGSNIYGDDAFGQRFVVEEPYTIYQAIYWIAETAGETGNVVFTIWDFDEQTGPGEVLATDTVALADLQASIPFDQAPVVTFDPPVVVTSDYLIGVDFSDLDQYAYTGTGTSYALTYGLVQVSTDIGDGGQLGYAWIRDAEGWFNLLEVQGDEYDVDIAIFPLVGDDTTSQEELTDQGQYHYYPNPASDRLHVVGNQIIREIRILDLTGRQVLLQPVNGYRADIGLHDFHSGIYILQIVGPQGTKTQKVQVMK